MVKLKNWNRRRGDDRLERREDYAPIQDAVSRDPQDDLSIPIYEDKVQSQDTTPTEQTPVPPATPINKTNPQVFALVGVTGGVGTTSIATQLAYEFAVASHINQSSKRAPSDPTVCLIDLDFESGSAAHHLDLLPSLTFEDLCGPEDHIDVGLTQALASTHESGISLLAAPNRIGANAQVNPHTVMAILDAATNLYDTVIIDLPRYHQPWSMSVMRTVDVFGLVCELTIPSLHAGRERLFQFSERSNKKINSQIILSKFERRSFKNKLRLSDAEAVLGRSILTTLCLDPDTTREALNCGEPAGSIRPDSRFVKDVRKLANSLTTATGLSYADVA